MSAFIPCYIFIYNVTIIVHKHLSLNFNDTNIFSIFQRQAPVTYHHDLANTGNSDNNISGSASSSNGILLEQIDDIDSSNDLTFLHVDDSEQITLTSEPQCKGKSKTNSFHYFTL